MQQAQKLNSTKQRTLRIEVSGLDSIGLSAKIQFNYNSIWISASNIAEFRRFEVVCRYLLLGFFY